MYNFASALKNINSFREGLAPDEDPTFLTFSLEFMFDSQLMPHLGLHSSPLLYGNDRNVKEADMSAQNFLQARGMTPQMNRLIKFKQLLLDISKYKPWYFQTITGIEKMWENSFNMSEGYKAKECVLEISTLEAVDLKISYIAELYHKAVYDSVYMREILPRGLRYFNMHVYVAEFRNFSRYAPTGSADDFNTQEYLAKHTSYYMYDCYLCEFDFSKTIPNAEFSVSNFDEPASNKFAIKVGMFLEKHNFSYYDVSVSDSFAIHGEFNKQNNV